MAIKNTLMGGTDYVNNEVDDADDKNDTFNAAANGYWHTTRANSSGGDLTTTSASYELKRTFTASDLETQYRLINVQLLNVNLKRATSGTASLGVEINNGTNTYYWQKVNGNNERHFKEVASGNPVTVLESGDSTYATYPRHIILPCPGEIMTGYSSYNLLVYMVTTGGNLASLHEDFTVQFTFALGSGATGTGGDS